LAPGVNSYVSIPPLREKAGVKFKVLTPNLIGKVGVKPVLKEMAMLEEKIMNDYKTALKSKNALAVSTLSFLRAQINYAALEKKKDRLDDAESLSVIKKLIKQHQDSIEQFTAGGRLDLVEKEKKEMDMLKSYLPDELSAEAVKKIVDETAGSLGASGIKDMGKVMKEVLAKTAGCADGKLVSELVRQRLAGPAA
jgi:uncharacterized protein YqeY